MNVRKCDAELWRKVNLALSDDSDFEDRVQTRVAELQKEEADAEGSIERIKRELGLLAEERQWVITQARKKSITEADMDKQLAGLDAQQQELRQELNDKSMLVGDRAGRLIQFANQYRAGMRAKLEWLNAEPRDDAERIRQFKARREIVEAIVRNVWVYGDKSIKVEFEFEIRGTENSDGQL
jgi:chromosome segregation ATPase